MLVFLWLEVVYFQFLEVTLETSVITEVVEGELDQETEEIEGVAWKGLEKFIQQLLIEVVESGNMQVELCMGLVEIKGQEATEELTGWEVCRVE